MIENKPDDVGYTENRTLECDFNSIESPSPLRNEYYQLADSVDNLEATKQAFSIVPQHTNTITVE